MKEARLDLQDIHTRNEEGWREGRKDGEERWKEKDCWGQLSESLLAQGCSANEGNNPSDGILKLYILTRSGFYLEEEHVTNLHRGAKWVSHHPRLEG